MTLKKYKCGGCSHNQYYEIDDCYFFVYEDMYLVLCKGHQDLAGHIFPDGYSQLTHDEYIVAKVLLS